MTKRLKVAVPALFLAAFNCIGQTDTGLQIGSDIVLGSDDNIYRVFDSISQSDTYISIRPDIEVKGMLGKHGASLSYKGDLTKFSSLSEADFEDHTLEASLDLNHSARLRTILELGFEQEHQDPGSIARLDLDTVEFNKYDRNFFAGTVIFGRTDSAGYLSSTIRITDRDFTNNNLDFLDNKSTQGSIRFTYRVAPKTRVYIEGLYSVADYEVVDGFTEQDNDYYRARAGLSWDISNKLTGDINVGYQDRNYDIDTLRDISGLAYDGNIEWNISSYTTLNLFATRAAIDSTLEDAGGFLRATYGFELDHEFSNFFSSGIEYAKIEDELAFTSARDDEIEHLELFIQYEPIKLVNLKLVYSHNSRKSSIADAEFDSNVVNLIATFLL